MKANKIKSLVLAGALLLGSAGSAWARPPELYRYVKKVQVERERVLGIAVTGNFVNTGCSSPWWAFIVENQREIITQLMLSVAIASYLAKKPVYVTTSGCRNGYPILTGIMVAPDNE